MGASYTTASTAYRIRPPAESSVEAAVRLATAFGRLIDVSTVPTRGPNGPCGWWCDSNPATVRITYFRRGANWHTQRDSCVGCAGRVIYEYVLPEVSDGLIDVEIDDPGRAA